MALEVLGEVAHGVVYTPFLDELFHARSGSGSYLNNHKIHVSSTARLIDAVVATGFPYDREETLLVSLRLLSRLAPVTRTTRIIGAAALDLCYVACGRLEAYWDLELWPWDLSAGGLIVEEAGGKVTDVYGLTFDHLGHNILASNSSLHQDILETIQPGRRKPAGLGMA